MATSPTSSTVRVRCLHAVFIVCGAVAFADFAIGSLDEDVLVYASIVLAVMLEAGTGRDVRPRQFDIRKLATWGGIRQAGWGVMLGFPIAPGVAALFAFAEFLARGELGADFSREAAQGFSLGLLIGPVLGLVLGVSRRLPDALTPRDPVRIDLMFGRAVGLSG